MGKENKLKHSEEKRLEPEYKIKSKKKKTIYPPHWIIRPSAFVYPSKRLKDPEDWWWVKSKYKDFYTCYTFSPDYLAIDMLLKNNLLDEALAIYTKHHPETKDWPVRFVAIQPMVTERVIIQ